MEITFQVRFGENTVDSTVQHLFKPTLGQKCGYVDYMQWPWIERLAGFTELGVYTAGNIPQLAITAGNYPNLYKYVQSMKQRPEVKACELPAELQLQFVNSLTIEKNPQYDLLPSKL